MLTHLLSLLIWLPMLFGVILLGVGRVVRAPGVIKGLGILFSLGIIALCVPLYVHFNASLSIPQFTELHPWIGPLNAYYALGVDGISVLFILLTAFTNLIMVLSVLKHKEENLSQYLAVLLFATGISNGLFAAQDALLFYMFWEASMIPILLGIGIWGGERRSPAALKFFLFNMLGSLMLLIALVYLYLISGTFNFTAWQSLPLTMHVEDWLFLAFFAAFAVKMPMWPLHTWFADLHAEAPVGGTIALSTLMLKTGVYGFLRFSLPMTAGAHHSLVLLLVILALIAIVYVGLAAVAQKDMKRLVAYSSVSHMGIVTLGIFMVMLIVSENGATLMSSNTAAVLSLQGALFQMLTHAFASGGLFLLVMMLGERFGSSQIQDYQGLAKTMPVLAFFFVVFSMANVGLPGTAGFIGEFFVILAALHANFWFAALAACTLVVSPAYMLWLVKRVIFGEVREGSIIAGGRLSCIEWIIMILLTAPVLYFGFDPHPVLHLSYAASTHLVSLVTQGA